jgi:hypothetical protein
MHAFCRQLFGKHFTNARRCAGDERPPITEIDCFFAHVTLKKLQYFLRAVFCEFFLCVVFLRVIFYELLFIKLWCTININ